MRSDASSCRARQTRPVRGQSGALREIELIARGAPANPLDASESSEADVSNTPERSRSFGLTSLTGNATVQSVIWYRLYTIFMDEGAVSPARAAAVRRGAQPSSTRQRNEDRHDEGN